MADGNRIKAAIVAATLIAVPAEGLRQYAYYDPPGILTVCYGSTTNVISGKRYSLSECKDRLDTDMRAAVEDVARCAPEAPESVLAAFGDAVYNLGPKIACSPAKSKAALYLSQGRWQEACDQLLRWNKASVAGRMVELPGLTKRRKAERELCVQDLLDKS